MKKELKQLLNEKLDDESTLWRYQTSVHSWKNKTHGVKWYRGPSV